MYLSIFSFFLNFLNLSSVLGAINNVRPTIGTVGPFVINGVCVAKKQKKEMEAVGKVAHVSGGSRYMENRPSNNNYNKEEI